MHAQSFAATHCLACDNAKLKTANLDLSAPQQTPATWEKVRERVASGKMPPPGLPVPPKAEVAAFLGALGVAAPNPAGPARITFICAPLPEGHLPCAMLQIIVRNP